MRGAAVNLPIPRVVALIVLACVLPAAGQQQNMVGPATQVVDYKPSADLPESGHSGRCWTDSIAAAYRPDAWRCMEGNIIHDPCFSLPARQAVVCDANPAARKNGFLLQLTEPLPHFANHGIPIPPNWAWLVELGDGTTCSPFTGTSPFISGEVGDYGCTSKKKSEEILLLGELDSSKPLWTARKAIVVKSGKGEATEWTIKSTTTVPIRTVWQ